ncbi:MAG: phosphohydrolase [Oscillospiraceae bacterium]
MEMPLPNHILTLHDVWMDPLDPHPQDICIDDIAHALSFLTRANGHFKHFYSVAQHCLNCETEAAARGFDRDTRLFCLLHDAAECYLSDLTRPVKCRFPLYDEAERRLQGIIFTALCRGSIPTVQSWQQVGEVDDCLLAQEFWNLRGVLLVDPLPVMCGDCDFQTREMAQVEELFLKRYRALS